MIDLIKDFLQEWRKKEEILNRLHERGLDLNERQFRKFVEIYDKDYCDGIRETYIAHSNKGYILTSDKDIIRRSYEDDLKRAFKLLKRGAGVKRIFKDDNQLTLLPEESKFLDVYEIMMKVDADA